MTKKAKAGTIGWIDLTAENAVELKDFYKKVVGWKESPVDMGKYNDFNMLTPSAGDPVTGICHKRGPNADIPTHWLIYINVEDIENSIKECENNGGQLISPLKGMGNYGKMCIIKDPAGAVVALFEPAE